MQREPISDSGLPFGTYEYYFRVGGVDRDGANLHIHHHGAEMHLQIGSPDHLDELARQLMEAANELREEHHAG